MYAKKYRLIGSRLFDKIHKQKSVKSSFFVIKSLVNRFSNPRFSLIISKKVSPKSVERNLLKKRLSEIIRSIIFTIKNFDIIIMVSPEAKKLSFEELSQEIKKAFKKANLFKDEKNTD